ncbi:hypothetical protein [Streptomyces sp. NRRL S-813]|uniref:hypothetical protein n=1 Tax=Streptomyces sp. NRRL S-813 TaxID=1463919 RepID=UPI00131E7FD1|nr:hypothetical protein [Streptomyces sp. NRRL S-813]
MPEDAPYDDLARRVAALERLAETRDIAGKVQGVAPVPGAQLQHLPRPGGPEHRGR